MANASMQNVLRHIRALAGEQSAADADDGQLLERFAVRQEPAAFNALLGRHGPMVLGVCRRVLRHAQDAEDVFQATFLLLACKARTIRRRASVGSWLHAVAYRLAVQTKVREARRQARERQATEMRRTMPGVDAAWQELQALIDEELQRLPEKQRVALVICYLEGQTQEEAARQLGWPIGTVRSRLARARDRLRKRLASRGLTLAAGPLAVVLAANTAATATVPAALARTTLEAAGRIAAGQAVAGTVSAHVVTLLDAASKSLSVMKLKTAALLLAGLCVLGAGAGVVAQRASTARQPEAQRAEEPMALARGDEPTKKEEPKAKAPKTTRSDYYGDPLPPGALARMGTVLLRHRRASVAFAADGKTLLSGGTDQTVRIWDVATGKQVRRTHLRRSQQQSDEFEEVRLSRDGKALAAWQGESVYLYDAATGKELHRLPVGLASHRELAFSPDAKVVATATSLAQRYMLRLWDTATGKEILALKHDNVIVDVAISPDGRRLLSLDGGPVLHLWDTKTGKELRNLRIEGRHAAFSPDSKTVALANMKGTVTLLGPADLKELATLQTSTVSTNSCLTFSPDGTLLAVGGESGIVLWSVAARKQVRSLPSRQAKWLAFAPEGKTLACASEIAIRLWDVTTGKELHHRPGHESDVMSVAVSPDGKTVASTAWDHPTLHLWDFATGKSLRLLTGHNSNIRSCGFALDGRWLISGAVDDGALRFWDTATGREGQSFVIESQVAGRPLVDVITFCLSPDAERLAAISLDYRQQDHCQMSVWDVPKAKLLARRKYPYDSQLLQARFTPDGKGFTVWSGRRLTIEETTTGRVLATMPENLGGPRTFSPDGKLLALGVVKLSDGHLQGGGWQVKGISLVEVLTGKEIIQFDSEGINHLDFSPDGRVLATTDARAICVWETATGKQLFRRPWPAGLVYHPGWSPVHSFVFIPGGRTVATGLDDGTILVWDLAPERWPATAVAKVLARKDLDQRWADLGGDDAREAHQALHTLAAAPAQSVALFKDHLRPAAEANPKRVGKLVADLDSKDFAVREASFKELAKSVEEVEPTLRRVLESRPSAEVRRRIETLLTAPRQVPSGSLLRSLRAIQVLEQIGTPEARQVLEKLAKGAPEARLTQDAKAALDRLAKRPATDRR